MGLYSKIKSKIFPDDKEVLYYSNQQKEQNSIAI